MRDGTSQRNSFLAEGLPADGAFLLRATGSPNPKQLDGVPGTAAPIPLLFSDTAGSVCGAVLPTESTVGEITLGGHADRQRHAADSAVTSAGMLRKAQVGLSNLTVLIDQSHLGCNPPRKISEVDADVMSDPIKLENINPALPSLDRGKVGWCLPDVESELTLCDAGLFSCLHKDLSDHGVLVTEDGVGAAESSKIPNPLLLYLG